MVTQNPSPQAQEPTQLPPGPGPVQVPPQHMSPHLARASWRPSPLRWTHAPTIVAEAAAIYFNKVRLCPAVLAIQPVFGSRRTRPRSREMVNF